VYVDWVFSGTLLLPWMEREDDSWARTEETPPVMHRTKININRKIFGIVLTIMLLLLGSCSFVTRFPNDVFPLESFLQNH
jgi:hypothetical protein